MGKEYSPSQRNELRVFLSSTFRDMTHERDYLNKTVFPDIKRIARERRVEFTAVDLRWGVTEEEARSNTIAVPGLKTSAYLGLRLAWGDVDVAVVPFDEIIPRILDGSYKSGLIIHEGQLTYVDHDLDVLIDLGKWWNNRTDNWPMPLGGNVVRRDLGQQVMEDITRYTKMSIEYALESPDEALEFAKAWGRGIDDETNEEFVGMYVNDRTIDYKDEGRNSIRLFIKEGQQIGLIRSDFDTNSLTFIGAE